MLKWVKVLHGLWFDWKHFLLLFTEYWTCALSKREVKKRNRKIEPNLPKHLWIAVPRDVLKPSPWLPLQDCVPAHSMGGFSRVLRGVGVPPCWSGDLEPYVMGLNESNYCSHTYRFWRRRQPLRIKFWKEPISTCEIHKPWKGVIYSDLKKMAFSCLALIPLLSTGLLYLHTHWKHSQQSAVFGFSVGWWAEPRQRGAHKAPHGGCSAWRVLEKCSTVRNVSLKPSWTNKPICC